MRRRANPGMPANQTQQQEQQIAQQQKQLDQKKLQVLKQQEQQNKQQQQILQNPTKNQTTPAMTPGTAPSKPMGVGMKPMASTSDKPYLLVSGLGKFADTVGEHVEDILYAIDTSLQQHPDYLGLKGNPDDLRDPVRLYAENTGALRMLMDRTGSIVKRDIRIADIVTLKPVTRGKEARLDRLATSKVAGPGFDYRSADEIEQAEERQGQKPAAPGQAMAQPHYQQPTSIGLKLMVNGKPVDQVPDEIHLRERYQQMGGIVLLTLLLKDQKKADLVVDLDKRTAIWTPDGGLPESLTIARGLGYMRRVIEKIKTDLSRAVTAAADSTFTVELSYQDDIGRPYAYVQEVKAPTAKQAVLTARSLIQDGLDRDIWLSLRGEQSRVIQASRVKTARLMMAFRALVADAKSDINSWFRQQLDARGIEYTADEDFHRTIELAVRKSFGDKSPAEQQDYASDILLHMMTNTQGQSVFDLYRAGIPFSSYLYFKARSTAHYLKNLASTRNREEQESLMAPTGDGEGSMGMDDFGDMGSMEDEVIDRVDTETDDVIKTIHQALSDLDDEIYERRQRNLTKKGLEPGDDKKPRYELSQIFEMLLEGKGVSEIARTLGYKSPSNASYQINRVRETVMTLLSQQGNDEVLNRAQTLMAK
jgi:hypothetical protein